MRVIRVHAFGGPDSLRIDEVPLPEPGPGEARVRVEFSGVNFLDIYHRTGLYPSPLPLVPGSEAAGVVDAVGEGVTEVRPGERVAFAMHIGSYAEAVLVPAWKLVPVPDAVGLDTAAAVLLQGLTAHYLTHSTFQVEASHTVLVHAAAGGTGQLLVQLAKHRGARVIATVSTEEKAEVARQVGADAVILYTRESFEERVRELTNGEGVDVVYDAVGKSTFDGSLASLRRRGMLVLYGQSSGPVPPVDPLRLSRGGSLFLTRPVLSDYIATRKELLSRAGDIFGWLSRGTLHVHVDRVLPLEDAAEAHRLLESRETTGKLLLRI